MTQATDMKPWQCGYELDYLSNLEARFRTYNEYARGPFSEMNKPKIAQSLHNQSLHIFDWGVVAEHLVVTSTPIKAYLDVVLARKEPGDWVVDAFCCTNPDRMTAYLTEFSEPTWVWIWEEDDQQRQIVEDAGYEFIGSHISSFAEIKGLYFRDAESGLFPRQHPCIDPVEFLGIQRTPINLDLDVAAAVEELNNLDRGFTPHYSSYAGKGERRGERTWSALSLRGYTADPGFIPKPAEMSKKWKAEHTADVFELQDTPLRAQLPAVDALTEPLTSIAKAHRIRLMRLTPGGGELRRHTDLVDKDSGISDGHVARFHIPIITNPDVIFNSWDFHGKCHKVHMGRGEVWYLDTRKPHRAINGGDTERTHLVVDVETNAAVRALLA